jgi:hypothetical protein
MSILMYCFSKRRVTFRPTAAVQSYVLGCFDEGGVDSETDRWDNNNITAAMACHNSRLYTCLLATVAVSQSAFIRSKYT